MRIMKQEVQTFIRQPQPTARLAKLECQGRKRFSAPTSICAAHVRALNMEDGQGKHFCAAAGSPLNTRQETSFGELFFKSEAFTTVSKCRSMSFVIKREVWNTWVIIIIDIGIGFSFDFVYSLGKGSEEEKT